MNKNIFALLFTAVLFGAVLSMPVYSQSTAIKTEKKIVLYVGSMDFKDWSLKAKKDSMGMDYLPVYLEEWGSNEAKVVEFYYLKLNSDKKSATLISVYDSHKNLKHGGKIGFYGDPMGPKDFSNKPKKDSMGMSYVPVYID
jgi:membrane fusion protein, copper/silver efflux system